MGMETTNHERTHAENWRGVRMMSSRTIRMVLGSLILFSMGFAIGGIGRAQQIPEALYSEMKWRMIGPFRGGRGKCVFGGPTKPGDYYFCGDGRMGSEATRGGSMC